MTSYLSLTIAALVTVSVAVTPVLAGKIDISSLPVMSSSVLVADNATPYTVTLTASAVAGYNDIRSVRVLFNFTESALNYNRGRGYLSWGKTDSDITNYGGTWVFANATGGGRWAYQTSPWDSTPYITPVGCTTSTGGSATGATGTRTVTFTFTVKPVWAANPLINDADAWAMTADDGPNESDFCKVGWVDNPAEFVVVAAPCTQNAAIPGAPVVSNPTISTLNVAINPADSDTDLFAIRISPPLASLASVNMFNEYVQADGTIGGYPVWQTKAAWGARTVTGLTSSTACTFTARAFNNNPGTCPSPWGSVGTGTTALRSHEINCAASGIAIHKGVHGMSFLPWPLSAARIADLWAASVNTSIRFGGDGYNWKTRTAQWNSNSTSTLEFLRKARDRNSYLQILTNTRGIGTGNGSTWVYTDQTPQTLAALTADWVYYCNVLVQTRRQGDPLTPEEQALLDSMIWGTDAKLLSPGEAAVPKVTWWEVGNEPEGPYPPPALTPTDYASRYNIISTAMLAKDPTIKVGPGCMTANNGNAWLDAVFANPANQVDFVAYHPYGNLYGITRDNTGGYVNPIYLMRGLNLQKSQQLSAKQKIVERLVANNRLSTTLLSLSEWNPSSWQGTYYYSLSRMVAQGLGVAENVLAFAEMGILSSNFWDQPNYPSTSGIESPQFKVFKALQAYLPDTLVDSLSDGYLRLYSTKDSRYQRIILWAVNLSQTDDKQVEIRLRNIPPSVTVASITRRTLAAYSGETSLEMQNAIPEVVGWTNTDLTGQIDPANFTMTFDNATLTLLIFDLHYLVNAPMVLVQTSFSRTAFVGTNPTDDTFTVASGGPDTLHYNISADVGWLSPLPASGSAGGTPVPIAIQYDTVRLAPGEHTGTITIASDDSYNSPQTVSVKVTITTSRMDFDGDGDIDLEEFAHMQACLSGTNVPQNNPSCANCKLDGDSDVDQVDLTRLVGCMSGAGIPPTPNCEN
ncbi:MAG TPA: hypothetical protein VLM89_02230 [Phycisphaerae bacterium]|nr:hypothetical protein [Phycisphaerae bacterium]